MSKIHKILILLILTFGMLIIFESDKVEAASASISSSKTVTQGSSVTVTGSVTAGAWNMVLSGAGQSKGLVGQTSTTGNQSASTSITFTASNVGTYSFTFSGDISDYVTDATTKANSTCTITVVAASNGNNNNSGNNTTPNNTGSVTAPVLSNLGITPHDFSGFTPSKTSYSVNVPNDCTSINLYATSKNGTVSGIGQKTLKEGTNKFNVIVSNSAGSKTYTVSVIRATADTDEVPNVIDEENTESPVEKGGIGLISLEVTGYTLEPEFKTDVYEYKIKTDKDLSLDDLSQIKENILAVANNDKVIVDLIPAISEDGIKTIAVVVRDAEKEYAKYVITFEKKEEEKVTLAPLTTSNSDNGDSGWFGLDSKQQIVVMFLCYGLTLFATIIFATIAFVQSRKLKKYEEDEDEVEELPEEETFFEPKSNFILNNNEEARMIELEDDKPETKELISETVSKLDKLNGYRNPRGKRAASGKHF